jgi:hypothetical protein
MTFTGNARSDSNHTEGILQVDGYVLKTVFEYSHLVCYAVRVMFC